MLRRMMVDIETLAIQRDASVLQIGAVCGDRMFEITINAQQTVGSVDQSVLEWWADQEPDTKRKVWGGTFRWDLAIRNFVNWVTEMKPDEVWAKGSDFDIPILENQMRQAGVDVPWKYYQVRDLRTLIKVCGDPGLRRGLGELMAHDALSDARFQMRQLEAILNGLKC